MISVTISNNLNRKTIITDENNTILSVLNENGVTCNTGTISIDGSTINAKDLNKSFKALGISEKCYISKIHKHDNAVEAIVTSHFVTIRSLPRQLFKDAAKFYPEALTLKNSNGDMTFAVTVGEGKGSISKYGISFSNKGNTDNAETGVEVPNEFSSNPKKWFEENYTNEIVNLIKVEKQVQAISGNIEEDKNTFNSVIREA